MSDVVSLQDYGAIGDPERLTIQTYPWPTIEAQRLLDTLEQQAREIARLEGVCKERLEQGQQLHDQLAAMTTERDQAVGNYAIQKEAADEYERERNVANAEYYRYAEYYQQCEQHLAAMTTERDAANAERQRALDQLAKITAPRRSTY